MAAPSRVIEIQERGQRFFPRSDLADAFGRSLILPETRELHAIDVRDVANGAVLTATGLIGYLPLTRTITLNIAPKFPVENLWTMLEVGGESYHNILPTLRGYQISHNHAPIHLLARSFCHYLRAALSAGLERNYYQAAETGYYKPRIEFGRTIGQYVSRGNPVETVSSVVKFGLNNRVNRNYQSRLSPVRPGCASYLRVEGGTRSP